MNFDRWMTAVIKGRLDTVKKNFCGEYLEGINNYCIKWKPIHYASGYGHSNIVAFLVENHVDLFSQTVDGSKAIHIASKHGHLNVVKVLIQSGADMESMNKDGSTAIHIASKHGHLNVVEFLIQSGADMESMNKLKERPLFLACKFHKAEIVKYLLSMKCEINFKIMGDKNFNFSTIDKWSSLMVASRKGNVDCVRLLLQLNHIDVDARNSNRMTALHLAAQYKHDKIVELLLLRCANPDCLDVNKQRALDVARIGKAANCIKLLENYMSPTNNYTQDQDTPQTSSSIDPDLDPIDQEDQKEVDQETDAAKKILHRAILENNFEEFGLFYDRNLLTAKIDETDQCLLEKAIDNQSRGCLKVILADKLNEELKKMATSVMRKKYEISDDEIEDQYELFNAIKDDNSSMFLQKMTVARANNVNVWTCNSNLEAIVDLDRVLFADFCLKMMIENEEVLLRLIETAEKRGFREMKNLLRKRKDFLHLKNAAGCNRLHIAVFDDRVDVVSNLLSEASVDPGSVENNGNTPLHLAFLLNHGDCARVLISSHSPLDATNKSGQNVLNLALDNGMGTLCDDLIMREAGHKHIELDSDSVLGLRCMLEAIISDKEPLCRALLATPTHRHCPTIELQPDLINFLNQSKKTRLTFTSKENISSICLKYWGRLFSCFLNKNAVVLDINNINFSDADGNTLLHIGAAQLMLQYTEAGTTSTGAEGRNNMASLCALLMQLDTVGPSLRNKQGHSPFQHAAITFSGEATASDDCNCVAAFNNLIYTFEQYASPIFNRRSLEHKGVTDAVLSLQNEQLVRVLYCHKEINKQGQKASVHLLERSLLLIAKLGWLNIVREVLDGIKQTKRTLSNILDNSQLVQMASIFIQQDNGLDSLLLELLGFPPVSVTNDIKPGDPTLVAEIICECARLNKQQLFGALLQTAKPIFDQASASIKLSNGERMMTELVRCCRLDLCQVLMKSHPGFVNDTNDRDQTVMHVALEMTLEGGVGQQSLSVQSLLEFVERVMLDCDLWEKKDTEGNCVMGLLFLVSNKIEDQTQLDQIEKMIKLLIRFGIDINSQCTRSRNGENKILIDQCTNTEFKARILKLYRFRQKQSLKTKPASKVVEVEKKVEQ